MSIQDSLRRSRFFRWVASGPDEKSQPILRAADLMCRSIEAEGFELRDNAFDLGLVPAHAVNFERRTVQDLVSFVLVSFDRRRRYRFQVSFGVKESNAPFLWVRSGVLTRKRACDSMCCLWWGAGFWTLNRARILEEESERAANQIRRASRFMEFGELFDQMISREIPTPVPSYVEKRR
jgi:hypothetical protein